MWRVDVAQLDAGALRRLLAERALSVTELVMATLERAEALNPTLRAFITIDHDGAKAAAASADTLLANKDKAAGYPLLGIPVSVKDLTPTRGLRTTRGRPALCGHVPARDAPAVARLRAAGAVIIGKTNTSEDGWSGGCVNRLFGATTNPWDRTRTSGGSSGGSAAAVAAGIGPLATGTDGAGSIRIPASFCGVVGMKPSFGRVPYVPVSPELLSHLGSLTRTVADAATMLDVLAGPDAHDPFSLDAPPAPATAGPLRIGWCAGFGAPAPEPEVAALAHAAVTALAEHGHEVEEIDPPFDDPYRTLVAILASADASEPGPVEPERAPVLARGRAMPATELAAAMRERARLTEIVRACMTRFDVLATPTVPILPFPAGAHGPTPAIDKGDVPWLAWTPNTYPANLTGQPAVSVPAGRTSAGLPVGVQLIGRWRADMTVLRAAGDLELARPWKDTTWTPTHS